MTQIEIASKEFKVNLTEFYINSVLYLESNNCSIVLIHVNNAVVYN